MLKFTVIFILFFLSLFSVVFAQAKVLVPSPPSPPSNITIIDNFIYPNSAHEAWSTHIKSYDDKNSCFAKNLCTKAKSLKIGKYGVLKLFCNFENTELTRGCWDRRFNLDLTEATAIVFDVYVDNLSALKNTIYIRNDKGWYAGRWFPKKEKTWCRIRLTKADFKSLSTETTGWRRVNTIRISPYARMRKNATIYIANLGIIEKATIPAVILSDNYSDNFTYKRNAEKFANAMRIILENTGINIPVVKSCDLTQKLLLNKKVLLLPLAMRLSKREINIIVEFVGKGGKLVACHKLPNDIANLLGISQKNGLVRERVRGEFSKICFSGEENNGSPKNIKQISSVINDVSTVSGKANIVAWWYSDNTKKSNFPGIVLSKNGAYISCYLRENNINVKGKLLKFLIGKWIPEIYKKSYEWKLSKVGSSINCSGWELAKKLISSQPFYSDDSKLMLQKAELKLNKAKTIAKTGEFLKSYELLEEIDALHTRAYYKTQKFLPNEFRAICCHPSEGLRGVPWKDTAKLLKNSGFNQLFLNTNHSASCSYPSKIVSLDACYKDKNVNWLKRAVNACKANNIKVYVWFVNYKTGTPGQNISHEQLKKFRENKRLQIDIEGNIKNWLCPSQENNIMLQHDALVEAAKIPGVEGIMFDYIRYSSLGVCYCDKCRSAFQKFSGKNIINWPDDVQKTGKYYKEWLKFRCNNITTLVKRVSKSVKKVAPKCSIGAFVIPSYDVVAKEKKGQDWLNWIKNGYIDFICPMLYTNNNSFFEKELKNINKYVDKRIPVYPGIGLFKCSNSDIITQIKLTRKLNTRGYFMWGLAPDYLDSINNLSVIKKP